MTYKTRTTLLSLIVIVVTIFSAFSTTTAYADGDAPPDPPPTEASAAAPDAASPEAASPATSPDAVSSPDAATTDTTAAPADATTAPTDTTAAPADATTVATTDTAAAPADATSTPDGAPADATATASATDATAPAATDTAAPAATESSPTPDASILTQVPDNTNVAVVDANGQTQPLATQAAADAVATSDPMWCPGTQAPGTAGCTGSFSSFSALLTELQNNPTQYQGAGTIYVQQGAYQGGETVVDFNSYNLSNINSADLAVTGGWNTSTNVVDSATPSALGKTTLVIGASGNPWGGSLSISNITITSPSGTGLTLFAQNNINLSNVSVSDSQSGAGAELDAGGDVTIEKSKFRENIQGVTVKSGGFVTVSGSDFSNSHARRRQNVGLDILATGTGAVTLFDVIASENRLQGVTINANGPVSIGGTAATGGSVFSGTKEIKGTEFLGYGLKVATTNTISIDNVTANDNFLWGASLASTGLGTFGNIAISNSIFNANTTASPGFIDDTGLFVTQATNVSLSNVTANSNRLYGAQITASGDVAINNSFFDNNSGTTITNGVTTFYGHGLKVDAGSISINATEALNNGLFGAQLNATGDVSIRSSSFNKNSTGSLTDLLGVGLDITSGGNTFLRDVILDGNQTVGANITAGANVFLDNVTATNNGADGVVVNGVCVEITGGTYTNNGGVNLNLGTTPLCPTMLSAPAIVSAPVNVFASLQTTSGQTTGLIPVSGATVADAGAGTSAGNVTLNSYLGSLRNTLGGIFTGKYAYVYSAAGMQVVAFDSPATIAMDELYRAY